MLAAFFLAFDFFGVAFFFEEDAESDESDHESDEDESDDESEEGESELDAPDLGVAGLW